MADHHTNPKRSTDERVEHIVVPDGDGYIRWNIINRGSDASGYGAVNDTDCGGAHQALKGRFRRTLNLVKSTLLFWH